MASPTPNPSRLKKWLGMTGFTNQRMVSESGAIVNPADHYEAENTFGISQKIIGKNATNLTLRMEDLEGDGVDHHFVIDIPPGKVIFLYSRILILTEGSYFIDAISVDSIDLTGAASGTSGPLDKLAGTPIQSTVKHVVGGAVNPVIREYGMHDTGSGQKSRAASGGSTSAPGVTKRLAGPSILRVRKRDAGTFTANLVCTVWEEDV